MLLRPKSFEVLRHLAANAGRLVSREELMQAVWPDVVVTDDSITKCVTDIRRAIGPESEGLVHTIPRRGYLLGSRPPPSRAAALALSAPLPPSMSIVVLPFENFSPAEAGSWFTDALTADITADLSNIEGSFVISRGTAFRFRRVSDPRVITRALGVRYALEGSVRRVGGAVHVTIQLVDGSTGACLWSERLNGEAGDLPAAQDELTGRVAQALRLELVHAEARRVERQGRADVGAADLAMRGWSALYASHTPAALGEARRLFEAALDRDPAGIDALTGLASAHAYTGISLFAADSEAELQRALALSEAVLERNPRSARAQLARGHALRGLRRTEDAADAYAGAAGRDRNYASAWSGLGTARMQLGRPEDEVEMHRRALALSPRDPLAANWAFSTGRALHLMGYDAEAIGWFRRARRDNPRFLPVVTQTLIAMACATIGDTAAAQEALAEAKQLDAEPVTTARRWAAARSDHPRYQELIVRTLEDLARLSALGTAISRPTPPASLKSEAVPPN
ncbi:MAG TPA: winged helix-turn-helix domain-containing protein [Acetobacteraceae bacterium]|nr:winged helix-turn-helix domain-containing protein [Acetobacteraceae bacterium]